MIPQIDFNNLDTKAEWSGALDGILDAGKDGSTDGSSLQALLLTYAEKCPFQPFCEIAEQANRGLGTAVISSAIAGILSRNTDFTAATDDIGQVTSTATKQASGLLMTRQLEALAIAKQALEALKPASSGSKAAGE